MRLVNGRRTVLAIALSLGFTGMASSSASAWEQWYCGGNVLSGNECSSSGLHSLYHNLAIAVRRDVRVGEYMYNGHLGRIRGGHIGYGVWFAERVWNRTNDAWYNAKSFNNDIITFYLDGYTRTG